MDGGYFGRIDNVAVGRNREATELNFMNAKDKLFSTESNTILTGTYQDGANTGVVLLDAVIMD